MNQSNHQTQRNWKLGSALVFGMALLFALPQSADAQRRNKKDMAKKMEQALEKRVDKVMDKLDKNGNNKVSFKEFAVVPNLVFDAADANGNGRINQSEFSHLAEIKAQLAVQRRLDTNKDGKISKKEFQSVADRRDDRKDRKNRKTRLKSRKMGKSKSFSFRDMMDMDERKVDHDREKRDENKLFNLLDANGDDNLTSKELRKLSDVRKQVRFDRLDDNDNGSLSRSEYTSLAHKRFERLDDNGDGNLSASEIGEAIRTAMKKKGEAMKDGRGGMKKGKKKGRRSRRSNR